MEQLRKNRAITMVSLIITIVLLLIIAGIGLNMGLTSMENANNGRLVTDLEMVQHAILQQYTKYKAAKDPELLIGFKLSISEVEQVTTPLGVTLVTIPSSYSNAEYYRLDKAALSDIGVTNTNDEYIVNYVSGEVINKTVGKTSEGKPLYIKANSFLSE